MNEKKSINSISPWDIDDIDDQTSVDDDNHRNENLQANSDIKSSIKLNIKDKEDTNKDEVTQKEQSISEHSTVYETLESYSMDSQNPWGNLIKTTKTITDNVIMEEDQNLSKLQTTQNLESYDPLKIWGVEDDAPSTHCLLSLPALPMKNTESIPSKDKISKHPTSTKSISSKLSNKTTKTSDKISTGSVLTLPSGKKVRKVKRSKAKKYSNIQKDTDTCTTTKTNIEIKDDDESSDSSLSQNSLSGRVEQTLARMKAVRNTHNVGDLTNLSPIDIDSHLDNDDVNQNEDVEISHHSPLHHLQLIDINESHQDIFMNQNEDEDENDLPTSWNESTNVTNVDNLPSGWITSNKSNNESEIIDDVLFPNLPFPINETISDYADCEDKTDESNFQTSQISQTFEHQKEDNIQINESKSNEDINDESSHSQTPSMENNTNVPTSSITPTDKEKTNQSLFLDFDPFAAPNVDVNNNNEDQNSIKMGIQDKLKFENMEEHLEELSETKTVISKYGPMWKKAVIFAENEMDKLDEEEYEREEKFLYIRSRAPPRINVKNQSENIKRLNERQNINLQKQAKLTQSLLAKTRSRADVDKVDGVFVAPPPTLFRASEEKDLGTYSLDESSSGSIMRTASNDIFITTNVARKRTKVVQLLIIGIIGVMGGFLGSIYAQSTCEFLIAKVNVGGNDNVFKLHFGMWKYSPIESAFQNYRYCNEYDDEYANESPTFIRLLVLISLLTGSFTMGVLWSYLILGLTSQTFWKTAIRMAFVSGCLQTTSLFFFFGDLCKQNSCSLGSGATVSIITTFVWFLLSYEMFHNTPELSLLPNTSQSSASAPLVDLELPEISNHIKHKLTFFQSPTRDAAPSLSMLRKKVQMIKNRGKSYSQDEEDESYCPPDYDSECSGVI